MIKNSFPFSFLWGTATSSHQVEGDNRHNDWWAWEQAGRVKEPSGRACDQYRLYKEDISLISELGHNGHRFSIEWSRIEPEEDRWNDDALVHYENILKELIRRGIEPVVTLHHFTNPQWFAARGGWLASDCVHYFVRYVERVVHALGRHVKIWITINEPLIFLYHGYFSGQWPPGVQSFDDALQVFRHLLAGHLAAYRTIHKIYQRAFQKPVWISIAHHLMCFTPCRPASFGDRLSAFLRDWFSNHLFVDAALSGFLFFPSMFCEFLSTRHALDFLGINYYARDFIRFAGLYQGNTLGQICEKKHHEREIRETNSLGWEVYPEGIYQVLKSLGRYHLPVLITENGICTEQDDQRVRFIREHLEQVERARQQGIPVVGYFHWSLLDNFEWAEGFGPRFGIVEVDYKTQERKVRPSAQVLTEICRKLSHGG